MNTFFSILFSLGIFCCLSADYSYFTSCAKLEELVQKVEGGEIRPSKALLSIDEMDMELLLKPSVVLNGSEKSIFSGTVACRGAATGVLCFDSKKLAGYKKRFGSVIWVTDKISNDDLCYIKYADGICAFEEDPSSHAIIVTRVNSVPCVTLIQGAKRVCQTIQAKGEFLQEGDIVTLDCFNGMVYSDEKEIIVPSNQQLLDTILKWCDLYSSLSVHANADTAEEAEVALAYGAKGIDPRSEHMFFHPENLKIFRKVILQKELDINSLNQLKEVQKRDIFNLFQQMKSYPIKIRLLDPPLHEFLPNDPILCEELAFELGISFEELQSKLQNLAETNPMMGHRGVRLLLTFPEILKIQARALFEAMIESSLQGIDVNPIIIIPMVVSETEVIRVKEILEEVRKEVSLEYNKTLQYKVGAMIETPRACLFAGQIAKHVSYFSFGTNDLTGLTFGFSRGDVFEKFLGKYLHSELLEIDPFASLDPAVVMLMDMVVKNARMTDHYVSIGICGEQASEKKGVFACHNLGLDSVSTAPQRVPIVRLFAAQAALLSPRE